MSNQKDVNDAGVVKALYSKIQKLAKVETVTKALLSELSRSILGYHVNGGTDIRIVNKLLSVLSPVNKRVAKQFFCYFLPHRFDEETCTFGKMYQKEGKKEQLILAMASFLHEPENDIWTWQEKHITMDVKPIDYAAKVTNSIKLAIEKGVDKGQVIASVLAGGVSVDEILAALDVLAQQPVEEAKAA